VAPKRLWGWEPREFAEYEYDESGRVRGVVTYREPEFDRAQVDLLLAHQRHRNDIGPHGQPMSEATDPQANPAVEGGWHYEATANGVMDYAELSIAEARDAYFKKYGERLTDAQKSAIQWRARRVDD